MDLPAFRSVSDDTIGSPSSQALRLGLELDHWLFWMSSLPTHSVDLRICYLHNYMSQHL